jgi:hypothetical protein
MKREEGKDKLQVLFDAYVKQRYPNMNGWWQHSGDYLREHDFEAAPTPISYSPKKDSRGVPWVGEAVTTFIEQGRVGLYHTQQIGIGFVSDKPGLKYAATILRQGLNSPELIKNTTEEEREAFSEDLDLRYKHIPGGRYTPLRVSMGYASIVARKPLKKLKPAAEESPKHSKEVTASVSGSKEVTASADQKLEAVRSR